MPAAATIIPWLECSFWYSDHAILKAGLLRRMAAVECQQWTVHDAVPPFNTNPIYSPSEPGITDAEKARRVHQREQLAATILAMYRGVPQGQKVLHLSGVGQLETSIEQEMELLGYVLDFVSRFGGITMDRIYIDLEPDPISQWVSYQLYSREIAKLAGSPKTALWCTANVPTVLAPKPFRVPCSHMAYPEFSDVDLPTAEREIAAAQAKGPVVVHIDIAADIEYVRGLWEILKRILRPGMDTAIIFPDGNDYTRADWQRDPANADELVCRARAAQRLTSIMPIFAPTIGTPAHA